MAKKTNQDINNPGYKVVTRDDNGEFVSTYENQRTKRLGVRIDDDLYNWLSSQCQGSGKTKSEIVIEALEMLRRSDCD